MELDREFLNAVDGAVVVEEEIVHRVDDRGDARNGLLGDGVGVGAGLGAGEFVDDCVHSNAVADLNVGAAQDDVTHDDEKEE